jgi:hypothetical protein
MCACLIFSPVFFLAPDDPEGEITAEKTSAIYALGELYAQKG